MPGKARYDYAPFGEVIGKATTPRLTFLDKEKDKESSLNDLGARKYDALIGRFTSVDPLWAATIKWSPYVYSINNPLRLIDKTGERPFDAFSSPQAAAHDFVKNYSPATWAVDREMATLIVEYKDDNGKTKYTYGIPNAGAKHGAWSSNSLPSLHKVFGDSEKFKIVGEAHTHPRYYIDGTISNSADELSAEDLNCSVPQYVGMPGGLIKFFDPSKGGKPSVINSDLPKDPKYGINYLNKYWDIINSDPDTRPLIYSSGKPGSTEHPLKYYDLQDESTQKTNDLINGG